jgi:hypothetical protein
MALLLFEVSASFGTHHNACAFVVAPTRQAGLTIILYIITNNSTVLFLRGANIGRA